MKYQKKISCIDCLDRGVIRKKGIKIKDLIETGEKND